MDTGDPDLAREARVFVLSVRHHWMIYHNHKETMASAGITLYIAAAASILGRNDLAYQVKSNIVLIGVVSLVAVLAIVYVKWQLDNRRYSSDVIQAIDTVAIKWLSRRPCPRELALVMDRGAPLIRAITVELEPAADRSWLKYGTGWPEIAMIGTMLLLAFFVGVSILTAHP
jgi:hypothetical protein